MKSYVEKIKKASQGLKYNLQFDKKASIFQEKEFLNHDKISSRARSMGGGKKIYYTNLSAGEIPLQRDFF